MSSLQGIYTKAYGLLLTRDSIKTKIRLRSSKNSFFKVITELLTEVDLVPWLAIYNSK